MLQGITRRTRRLIGAAGIAAILVSFAGVMAISARRRIVIYVTTTPTDAAPTAAYIYQVMNTSAPQDTKAPTATPSVTITPSTTFTPSIMPTFTLTASETESPTLTATLSLTPTPSVTESPTFTDTIPPLTATKQQRDIDSSATAEQVQATRTAYADNLTGTAADVQSTRTQRAADYYDTQTAVGPAQPTYAPQPTRVAQPTAIPQATLAPTVRAISAPATAVVRSGNPLALCNDGTYSYAAQHRGACAGHKGVAVWYR